MKKITLEKNEEIADVIERMLGEGDDELTIVVPKGSPLGRSVANFHLLKREAEGAGKTIAIESVDDTILAFAKESELDASHPLWRGVRGSGGISDIIPAGDEVMPEAQEAPRGKASSKKSAGKKKGTKLTIPTDESAEEGESIPVNGGKEEDAEEEGTFMAESDRFFKPRSAPEEEGSEEVDDFDSEDEEESYTGGKRSRKWPWAVGAVVLVLVVLWGITSILGHAAIAIDFQKTPWSNTATFAADKSVSSPDTTTGVIPAQVFTANKNTTQLFPASGSANVSLKAQGTLTIYNAYSSAPQELVAKTRFVTPDGKLFRLVAGVTIPGAQVSNGAITPSSITATVAADQPGPAYNVGPVQKLTIPGFQGTARYNGFYGALLGGASGGFTGTRAVPTNADVLSAKSKMTSMLQSGLSDSLTSSYPNNFKILDGATNIAVTKLTVNTTTDQNGNFSVFGEATLQAIGFDEAAFKDDLLTLAGSQASVPNPTWKSLTLSYGNVHADFTKGRVSFMVNATGTLEQAFSPADFKASIEGKSVSDARTAIAAIPGLTSGKLSVWPLWLWSVPSNPDKIQITTD